MNKFRTRKLALYVALLGACGSSLFAFGQAQEGEGNTAQLEEI